MVKSSLKVKLNFDIVKVWNKVTYLENYSWRSDLNDLEVLNNDTFIINKKKKNPTVCKITFAKLYRQWEIKIDNKHFSGEYAGIFKGDEEHCVIEFYGNLKPKNIYILPFLKDILKKEQTNYINDLQKALLSEVTV